jgi:hypothetical protein
MSGQPVFAVRRALAERSVSQERSTERFQERVKEERGRIWNERIDISSLRLKRRQYKATKIERQRWRGRGRDPKALILLFSSRER